MSERKGEWKGRKANNETYDPSKWVDYSKLSNTDAIAGVKENKNVSADKASDKAGGGGCCVVGSSENESATTSTSSSRKTIKTTVKDQQGVSVKKSGASCTTLFLNELMEPVPELVDAVEYNEAFPDVDVGGGMEVSVSVSASAKKCRTRSHQLDAVEERLQTEQVLESTQS